MKDKIHKLDIPEVIQVPQFMKVLDDLNTGNNVFLVGGAGTGKTTLAEKVAYAKAGRFERDHKQPPFVTINCNQWTSPVDIKGGQTIEGYREGALIEAWRDGKILILDEMPKLDANTAGILNEALAKNAVESAIIFNGQNEPISKHPDFGCIATGNVLGKGSSSQYVGNHKQDASLLDRFSGCVYHIGFNEVLERQIIYPLVANICIAIRKAILRYEGKSADSDDSEDLMTLRTMLNLQRGYILEMLREMGLKNHDGTVTPAVPQGKTLKDGLESFFYTMNREKAHRIREEVNLEGFYNSYRGKVMREEFIREYQRRKKS